MIKKIIKFLPSILWMLVIFYFSSKQTTGIGVNNENYRFLILKSFHLIEYALLALLLYFAVLKRNSTIIISYLYALSDEIHQSFVPGRTPKLRDTIIDLVGILIGVFIFQRFYLKRYKS